MLQHRHPNGQASTTQKSFIGPGTEILAKNRFEILRPNTSPGEFALKPLIREERLATEDLAPGNDPLFKRKMLERVQRVVMNERSDRPLRRKEMSNMLDLISEMRKTWQIRTLGA
jgi:hypothetical protein